MLQQVHHGRLHLKELPQARHQGPRASVLELCEHDLHMNTNVRHVKHYNEPHNNCAAAKKSHVCQMSVSDACSNKSPQDSVQRHWSKLLHHLY